MKEAKINGKKKFIFILILCVLAVVIIIAFKVREEYEPPETTGGLEDRKLDPDVKKLFEADSDSAGDYEVFLCENFYDNSDGQEYLVDDPETADYVVESLSSLSIKEILPTSSYYGREENGLGIKISPKGIGGEDCSVVILGKNKEGNYVLSLAEDNAIMAEVVEGELDYAYLKELYQEAAEEK
ncbi:hypothetical protein LI221_14630 [Faecalimonas umbilicata]|nr:hypothetical protein [Faecalimonas umbilicata]